MNDQAIAALERIAENTKPKRRMLQCFGDMFVDPSEIVCIYRANRQSKVVWADGNVYRVCLASGEGFELDLQTGRELLAYISLDCVS